MLAGLSAPALAAEPGGDLTRRAEELVLVLRGDEAPGVYFAPSFLAQVPAEQMRQIAAQLRGAYGRPLRITPIQTRGESAATFRIEFEKATARVEMALDPAAPHLVTELLINGVEPKADTLEALGSAFRALPGHAAFAAARLDEGTPQSPGGVDPEAPLAVGSDFKLFVLAELVRAVKAGERRWSDVVPISARSLPSGILQSWPQGAPATLHTLAALMISQSDNTAADTLLAIVGRDKVERLLPALGVRPAARDRPFLSTREAFLLKAGDPSLLPRWRAADEAGRRALLASLAGTGTAGIDIRRFLASPLAIDAVEWYASPADLVRTLDWIRRSGDRTALDILAINPGLPAAAGDFAYVGYKGGSESGVMAMAFLVRRKDGGWAAAAGAWNNPTAPVDETQFAALMGRLLTLLR